MPVRLATVCLFTYTIEHRNYHILWLGLQPRMMTMRLRGIVYGLGRILRHEKSRIILSLILATFYVLLLLSYTRGRLLYGGDFPGFYSTSELGVYPSPTGLVFASALLLTNGVVYSGFYLGMFISAFLVSLAMGFLARQLFSRSLGETALIGVESLAGLLYMLNPTSLTDTFKSFTTNMFVENAALAVFLGMVIRTRITADRGKSVRGRDILAMGLALGISAEFFPNNVRTVLVGVIVLVVLLLFDLPVLEHARAMMRSPSRLLGDLGLFVTGVFVGGSYSLLPDLANLPGIVSAAAQGAANQGSLAFVQGQFNTLVFVFRLLGVWSFSSGYAPYYQLYSTDSTIVFVSYLWPLLGIAVRILISRPGDRSIVLSLESLGILMIAWECAGNLPLDSLYRVIISNIPFGPQLLPTYFLSVRFLSKIFAVLASYAVALILTWRR